MFLKKASLKEKIHYRMDNYLAKGSGALFASLLIAFLIAFSLISVLRLAIYAFFPENVPGIQQQLYRVFLELTAPGNMNQDVSSPPAYKLVAILAGLTGVVIFSTLIATITTALNQAIRQLRRGHSRVLESGHTLILGWSHRVPEILRELFEANDSEDSSCVVILAEEDKEWMDDYLRNHVRNHTNTRVVTRSGLPASPEALSHVSVRSAKSVIVLASCDENATAENLQRSDARAIKVILALEAAAQNADFPIVTELFIPRNREVVSSVAQHRAFMVDAEEILAKIMVQTSRTSGLSVVYSELLSFEGCEMYFHQADWQGIRFDECQFRFPDGIPIGIRDASGQVTIRPPLDTKLGPDDEILLIAEDDTTIDFRPSPVASFRELPFETRRLDSNHEKMLMIGWSPKAPIIISEYSDYVLEGSAVTIALQNPDAATRQAIQDVIDEQDTLDITLVEVDPFSSQQLAELDPFSFNDMMILPQRPGPNADAEKIDSETIVVLLLLRKLKLEMIQSGRTVTTKIVTEVLESENHSLIHQAGVNDFIISNRLVSMIFAQISEEPDIQAVYDDLFQEDGSEIYVKPVHLYFDELPVTVTYADLIRLAQKRDEEICIGYKIAKLASRPERNYGVQLIPPKDDTIELRAGDALIVVAEDER